jgi:cellobiose phosphorylase
MLFPFWFSLIDFDSQTSLFLVHLSNTKWHLNWIYVALDAPIKFAVMKVRNESGRSRSLSATGYVEWVLGDLRSKTGMHVITEMDPGSGAFFARNS